MKKHIILPFLLFFFTAALWGGNFTPRSLLVSDSYMLRARGCDANYWNPALLNRQTKDIWLPVLNLGVHVGNNAADLDLYNYVMDREFLDEEDKNHIMDAFKENLALSLGGQIALFGFTTGNVALSSSVHLNAKASQDRTYLKLLLFGNGDGSEVFNFDETDTNLEGLGYFDVTVGVGDILIPLPETVPDIKFGFAVSALGGILNTTTNSFEGHLSSNLDGFNFQQNVKQLAGAGGYGAKAMLGLYSEPIKNLSVGATLDNAIGFIRWGMIREELDVSISVDSLYAIDLLEDIEDIYSYEISQEKTDSYTSRIPVELRFAAQYDFPQASISVDYIQGFGDSPETSRQARFALGAELRPIPLISIYLGYGTPTRNYPWRTSLGLGFNVGILEFGMGVQSIEQFYPGYTSKGIALANYFNIRF